MSDVREQGITIKEAAKRHGINRSTLINHLKNYKTGKVGRPAVLTPAEESIIVHALKKLGEWGFGVDREAVQSIVMDYLRNANRQTPFKDGKPGPDWMRSFEKRWENELTRRVGQPLPASRAYACNQKVVDDFYEKLRSAFERLNLSSRPQNVFNCDETGFQTDIGAQKVFCERGLKNPHKTVATSTKTTYTVQVCVSAIGHYLPLYVVYKGLNLYDTWCTGGPDDARYTSSPSGWMETDQFLEWFQKIFITETKHLDGMKLLIFDGHSSHINTKVVELALSNNIELLCLPAHTSSILQPLDVGVFKGVKGCWRKSLRSFYDETRCSNVDKKTFPSLLKRITDAGAFSRTSAISGFDECGIFPLNPAKITADKLATSVPLMSDKVAEDSASQQKNTSTSDAAVSMPCQLSSVLDAASNEGVRHTVTTLATAANPAEGTTPVTPRKGIEKAILAHLRHVTPAAPEKKRRLKRTFAECLTAEESRARVLEADKAKRKPGISQRKKLKKCPPARRSPPQRRQDKVKLMSSKPELVIRKPVWLQQRKEAEEGRQSTATQQLESTYDASQNSAQSGTAFSKMS